MFSPGRRGSFYCAGAPAEANKKTKRADDLAGTGHHATDWKNRTTASVYLGGLREPHRDNNSKGDIIILSADNFTVKRSLRAVFNQRVASSFPEKKKLSPLPLELLQKLMVKPVVFTFDAKCQCDSLLDSGNNEMVQ
ncbi:hypothetical protein CDAR_584131 [Caerostris darwini]|uniref:Uncharacterized protein n=1 Tax=Caerostris darwini TaxID=1538125 RepID=A0AAV4W7I3_9ARAC|nr:hypothetical protein CDAR_584131 [Caerostris darwini]